MARQEGFWRAGLIGPKISALFAMHSHALKTYLEDIDLMRLQDPITGSVQLSDCRHLAAWMSPSRRAIL
jgi:hypothetical protein